jgi:acyl-CoA thioesterase-1
MKRLAQRVGICIPLAAALVACSCESRGPTTPPTVNAPPIVRRVLVLGDSLATFPSLDQSFPAVLQRRMTGADFPWTVTNASLSGDTTSDGLRRVDALLTDDVGVLVVALGANDGLRGLDVALIKNNLSAIVTRAQARGIRVLLCGMETLPLHSWDYTVDFHRVFPRVASEHAIPLVPFLLAGVALNPDLNGADGIHPNAAGAQRIADTVWPYLEPLLREK